jgi:hypothetical protein
LDAYETTTFKSGSGGVKLVIILAASCGAICIIAAFGVFKFDGEQ